LCEELLARRFDGSSPRLVPVDHGLEAHRRPRSCGAAPPSRPRRSRSAAGEFALQIFLQRLGSSRHRKRILLHWSASRISATSAA